MLKENTNEEISCIHLEEGGLSLSKLVIPLGDNRSLTLCKECKDKLLDGLAEHEYARGVVFREPFAHSNYKD